MRVIKKNSISWHLLSLHHPSDSRVSKNSNVCIDSSLVQELRNRLGNSTVLKLESEGYQVSIKRWSEAIEKRAVSHICGDCMPDPVILQTMKRVSSCTWSQPNSS